MSSPLPLHGHTLKQATSRLAAELQEKIEGPQRGVGTFSDHALIGLIARLEQLDDGAPWEETVSQFNTSIEELKLALQRLQLFLTRRSQGRFVEFSERIRAPGAGAYGDSDISGFDLAMSQGAFDCMQWKGMPLFKTVYDFSIYTMLLWSLRPGTIVELGSGAGASAIWLADLADVFGLASHVYSVDLKKPECRHERVTFVEGDCAAIETVFDEGALKRAAHPWVLIEDAHVNVCGVLKYFHSYLAQNDYVVVEDSAGKQDDIAAFLMQAPGCYKVDTYYTDFFGRNVTCARDSILVRV